MYKKEIAYFNRFAIKDVNMSSREIEILKGANMSTVIYYFTGTGSSLAVAKRVATVLEDATYTAIKTNDSDNTITLPKRVGFVFPNYYATIPEPVKAFITKLDFSQTEYTFAILNAGGNPGLGLEHLAKAIKKQGGKLHYSAFLRQGSNYIVAPYYTAMSYRGEALRENLRKNNSTIKEIISDIEMRKESKPRTSIMGYGLTRLMYGVRLKENRLNLANDFSVSTDCSGCGICAKVCPADNITMDSGKPQWKSDCQDCCACIQMCRSEAILLRGKKLNKERFIHPEVTVKEIIAGNS